MDDYQKITFLQNLLELLTDDALFTSASLDWPRLVSVNCNDFFGPGCADSEDIEPNDNELLQQSYDDVHEALGRPSVEITLMLFAARKRHTRPHGGVYKNLPEKLAALFNAAGPPRS